MAKHNELKDKLAEKANGKGTKPPAAAGSDPAQTVYQYLEKMKPQIERALPKHLDADRLARIALTTIRTTPKLLNCKLPSLMGAVMQAAQLGLEPNILGHCYIIPYKKEATFLIGYRGMIELARRSGNIESIYAHEVREHDDFAYELGLEPKLEHRPALEDRGAIIGAYAVAKFPGGGYQFDFMPVEEIEKRRQRSAAANSGPWQTDYVEMAKKTVIRRMFKYLPVSVELMQGVEEEAEPRTLTEIAEEAPYIDVDSDREEDEEAGEENQAEGPHKAAQEPAGEPND